MIKNFFLNEGKNRFYSSNNKMESKKTFQEQTYQGTFFCFRLKRIYINFILKHFDSNIITAKWI